MAFIIFAIFAFLSLIQPSAFAAEITTNAVAVHDAPSWLTESRVNRVTDKIQSMLEWDIRRVTVNFYARESEFSKAHGLNVVAGSSSAIMAASRKADNTVHIGPQVNSANFDGIFGHELGHIIMYQKYKDAIPQWLEEGLANFAAKNSIVDYKWLARQPAVDDVRTMGHPFGKDVKGPGPQYHYMASTALMEMLAAKCGIHSLLQLSLGETLESYLATLCEISDVNAEFKKWIARKAR